MVQVRVRIRGLLGMITVGVRVRIRELGWFRLGSGVVAMVNIGDRRLVGMI